MVCDINACKLSQTPSTERNEDKPFHSVRMQVHKTIRNLISARAEFAMQKYKSTCTPEASTTWIHMPFFLSPFPIFSWLRESALVCVWLSREDLPCPWHPFVHPCSRRFSCTIAASWWTAPCYSCLERYTKTEIRSDWISSLVLWRIKLGRPAPVGRHTAKCLLILGFWSIWI